MSPSLPYWTDPRTWPWTAYIWIAFALLPLARPIWRWFQRRRAETWPAAQGRVESTEANRGKTFLATSSSALTTSFNYSYEVGGTRYFGTYKKQFGTLEESEDFLRDLIGKELRIQYNSENPSHSYILDSSINSLLATRIPTDTSALETHRYRNPLPLWFNRSLPLFEVLAIIGFVLSVVVNVGVMTSRWSPPNYFWALHGGIFLVFLPAILVAQKQVGSIQRRDYWNVVLKGAPEWMRYFLYALFVYAFVVGLPDWFRPWTQATRPSSTPHQSSVFGDWTVFSAVWMGFYWGSFVILYAAIRQDQLRPRCVNGHLATPGVNFCGECGQPILRT